MTTVKEHLWVKGSPRELLLDLNLFAGGYSYFRVPSIDVSPDNRILAFAVDTMGNHHYTILFKDLLTGEMLDDRVLNSSANIAWANNSRTFFFGRLNGSHIIERIMRRELGSADEVTVFFEEDPLISPRVYRSRSGDFILLSVLLNNEPSEFWFLDADNPQGDFTVVQPRTENLQYWVYPSEEQFYVLTNLEAQNIRLMRTDFESPSMDNWVEVIPNRQDVLLRRLDIFREFMVLSEIYNGLRRLRVIEFGDSSDYYLDEKLDFEEQIYFLQMCENPDYESDNFLFKYSSMITPRILFDYNVKRHERSFLDRDIPMGYDETLYQSERLWATARDGTQIPISLLYRKDLFHPSENPLLLAGYGAYGSVLYPSFRHDLLCLLDRGFVYAIAHIRGGCELGNRWYESGRLLDKMNTFTDFIDCAEYLINENFCNEEYLFAQGSSAGGLLMGVVVNMRPDLWKGVIAGVPFVDIVTTSLDDTNALLSSDYSEWGNPNYPVYYKYMLSYSPYDNVRETDYPAMLVYTGLHDSQVGCWEPAKWVAKLRAMKTDDNPLLLYTNMEAGHGGPSGRFNTIDLMLMKYTFILDLAGF